jgi:hypothetical protein
MGANNSQVHGVIVEPINAEVLGIKLQELEGKPIYYFKTKVTPF